MKKILLIIIFFAVAKYLPAQQVFTTFQKASMVIGQPYFTSIYTNSSDSITYGPSYCAISSKGMLAVAEQSGSSVKIWNTMPTRNGQPSDVQLSLPFSANGLDWSPDGNKLVVAGGSNSIYIWDSIPATNGQGADVTINLYTQYPQGVLITPGGKLLIAERYANRILVWNSIPTEDNTPADYVIGQPDMVTTTSGNGSGKLNSPWGLDLSPDGRLLIADESNSRVVVYDSVPETFGDTATVVIGQTNFGISNSGCSDSTQNTTVGVTVTVDGKVAISEYGNNRVTIFNSVPTTNNAKASVVLGQPNFTTSTNFYPSGSPDTANMSRPYAISSDLNGRLFLCGRDMRRVMVFGELPADSADLSISITGASDALCDSSIIVYSMKIKNLGNDTAKSITATTAFADGFQLTGFSTQNSTYTQASGYWSIPVLTPKDSIMLILSGLVDSSMSDKTITTYANIINSSALDTNLNNNGTSLSVTILNATRPADPVTTNTTTCSGTTAILTASGAGTINWYSSIDAVTPVGTGESFETGTITSSTTYYAEAFDVCPSMNRVAANVTVNTINTEVISQDNTLTSSESNASYQWINCSDNSEISGEVSQAYTAPTTGSYAVVISKDECIDTTSCSSITIDGLTNTLNTEISVYPNPVSTSFTIDMAKMYNEVVVTIMNNNGQEVMKKSYSNSQLLEVNMQELPAGMYFIRIGNISTNNAIRIVKE